MTSIGSGRWRTVVGIAAFGALCSASAAQAQRGPAGTLIVSNMNDNTATMVNAATGQVIATLPTGEAPHEVASSHDGRWALVSNYGVRGKPGNTITVIDVKRHVVARTIDLHDYRQPHGMAFLPGDTLVVVTAQANKAVLLMDFRSGAVLKAMPTNGRVPHMLGVSARGDRLVTGDIADNAISVLSLPGGSEPQVIPVAHQPEGVAITPDGNHAWAGSNRDSVVLVADLRSGTVIDTLRGFGLPYRIAISPDGRKAVITDPVMATIRVFDAATRAERFKIDVPRDSLVEKPEVPGSPSPEGVTIAPDSRWAFVTLQGRNRVVTIDLERGTIVRWAPTGIWSDGIAFSRVISQP
jgi:YVTN family beta-propeller protein